MLNFVMFVDPLALAVLGSTLFVLHRRGDGAAGPRGYRMPLYPLLPLFYVVFLCALAASVFYNDVFVARTYDCLVSLALMAAGLPLFYLMRRVWPTRLDTD
jgi:hypothetical protein